MVIDKTSQCGTEWAVRWQAWSGEVWRRGRRGRLNSGPLLLRWASWGQTEPRERRWSLGGKWQTHPWGNRQESANRSRMKEKVEGGSKWHCEVSATAWSVLSAVGQLSALLSSLGFMSDSIYLAVKPQQPFHGLSPSSSLSPSITNPPPPSLPPSFSHSSLSLSLHLSSGCIEVSTSMSSDSSGYISEWSAACFILWLQTLCFF